jgi:hypothetical protein
MDLKFRYFYRHTGQILMKNIAYTLIFFFVVHARAEQNSESLQQYVEQFNKHALMEYDYQFHLSKINYAEIINILVDINELKQPLSFEIHGHVGAFCRINGEVHLPRDFKPEQADQLVCGASLEYQIALGQRYAQLMTNMVNGLVPAAQVDMVSYGSEKPRAPYPLSEPKNFEELKVWNQIAAQNNRVELVIVP